MTIREERDVRRPPSMVLAAIGTAGENLGWTVRDVLVREGLLVMTTRPKIRGASLGFIVTVRARRFNEGTKLSVDATPMLGSWARKSADDLIQDLFQEYQLVMSAPQARIRRPLRATPDGPPFGALPQVLGVAWALLAIVVFGVLAGGWWWVPAAFAVVGAALLFTPRNDRWWNFVVVALAVLSLPFGAFGAVARRLARTNVLWEGSRLA